MYYTATYKINWDLIKTQDDLIIILKNLNLSFDTPSEDLKKLCVLIDKSTGKELKPKSNE